ncbi:MAG: MerR family transcriptional regulator [Desulfobulbaceae bacterium]|nr:MerR family transcriptional regulator [Desulfobulbaceae bacterium]
MGGSNLELSNIPDKVYFKIGEVCQLTGIKAHTLRYWESEFSIIKPRRAGSQQRLYRRIDVENILQVKRMLHDDGMTLAGTRKALARQAKSANKGTSVSEEIQLLYEIKNQLLTLKRILK